MNDWLLLALGGLNLLVLILLVLVLWVLRAQASPKAQDERVAEQSAWLRQQFEAVHIQSERLER